MATCDDETRLFADNSSVLELLHAWQGFYAPIHGGICVVMCLFGIVTNILHILVLLNVRMRSAPVHTVLAVIAVCDLGTMCSYLPYLTHYVFEVNVSDCEPMISYRWVLFLKIHVWISITLHTASLWLAVLMAFIRTMTLRSGRLTSVWHKSSTAWTLNALVCTVVAVLLIPTLLVHSVEEIPSMYNTTRCEHPVRVYTLVVPEFARKNGCVIYKANLWLTGIMFKCVPCLFLLLLSSDLLWRLRQANQRRKRMVLATNKNASNASALNALSVPSTTPSRESSLRRLGRNRHTDRTNVVLLTVVLVFLVTELPQGAIALLSAVYTTDVFMHVYLTLGDVSDLLSLINCSVNFILYCVVSSKYRQTFWQVLMPTTLYRRFLQNVSSHTGLTERPPATSLVPNGAATLNASQDPNALALNRTTVLAGNSQVTRPLITIEPPSENIHLRTYGTSDRDRDRDTAQNNGHVTYRTLDKDNGAQATYRSLDKDNGAQTKYRSLDKDNGTQASKPYSETSALLRRMSVVVNEYSV